MTLKFQFLVTLFISHFEFPIYQINHLCVHFLNLQFLLFFLNFKVIFVLFHQAIFDHFGLSLMVLLSIDNLRLNCLNFVHHYFKKNHLLFQIVNLLNLKNFILLVYNPIRYLIINLFKIEPRLHFCYLTINVINLIHLSSFKLG